VPIQRQNPGRLIPVPMLSVNKFHRAQKIRFAGLPSMDDVKKSLALRDHRIVMTCRATDRQGSPSGRRPVMAPEKFPCADSRSLVRNFLRNLWPSAASTAIPGWPIRRDWHS